MESRKNEYNVKKRRSLHDSRSKMQLQVDEETEENNERYERSGEDSSENGDASLLYERNTEDVYTKSFSRTPELSKNNVIHSEKKQKQLPQVSAARRQQSAPAAQNQSLKGVGYYILCVMLIVGIATAFFFNEPEPRNERRYCSFKDLQQRNPLQPENVWKKLSVGIELILNKDTNTPSVYLFLNHGSTAAKKLVNDIAVQSSACFDPKMQPVHMDSSDFTSPPAIKDYGYAIEQYKMKIKNGNVILILNLNEIPVEAARALHTICDTYSPIAEDVVIFLTLTTTQSEVTHPEQTAIETLEKLWSPKLDRNELDPLITRVTDQVILLKS